MAGIYIGIYIAFYAKKVYHLGYWKTLSLLFSTFSQGILKKTHKATIDRFLDTINKFVDKTIKPLIGYWLLVISPWNHLIQNGEPLWEILVFQMSLFKKPVLIIFRNQMLTNRKNSFQHRNALETGLSDFRFMPYTLRGLQW